LDPLQMAVGVKGGMESTIHAIRSWMDINPDHVVSIDCFNANGTISRAAIRACFDKIPNEKAGLNKTLFSNYTWRTNTVLADGQMFDYNKGFPQGFPTSTQWFCLAQHAAVEVCNKIASTNGARVIAYADDVFIMGPLNAVSDAYDCFTVETANVGLRVNPRKTSVLIRQASQEKMDWAQHYSFPEPKQCIDVLGTPVGDPESESQAAKDMVSTQMFDRLQCVQSHQIKLLLLRQCLVTRMAHLSRTLPPESSIKALDKLNADVESFISEVFEIDIINDLKWM
jgi:hypothetical protein